MPAYLIDALLAFGPFVRSGKASEVLHTVEQLTGRRPLTVCRVGHPLYPRWLDPMGAPLTGELMDRVGVSP
jgi:hypothetical protein